MIDANESENMNVEIEYLKKPRRHRVVKDSFNHIVLYGDLGDRIDAKITIERECWENHTVHSE